MDEEINSIEEFCQSYFSCCFFIKQVRFLDRKKLTIRKYTIVHL